jgi:hypothetical protein
MTTLSGRSLTDKLEAIVTCSWEVVDTRLHSIYVRAERKQLTLDLKENPRGRFLRIIEEVNGRHNAIVIPMTGLEQFRDALNEVINLRSVSRQDR